MADYLNIISFSRKGYTAICLQSGSDCLVPQVLITYIYYDSLYYKRFVV